ncbi:homocysteine S-methyltransferase family protein [Litorivicinus sp.]|nr:homocysteine S-methyltransferase family protein [Litorivicinus sp.]
MAIGGCRDVVLLDGGIGQEIHRRSTRGDPHPLWSVMVMHEEPDVVVQVYKDFLHAGAKVLTLNTYAATPIRLGKQGMESELNKIHQEASALVDKAIENSGIARSQISKMGCLPPLAASYVAEAAPDYAKARSDYEQLIEAQIDYVDGFLVETMSNTIEMTAARDALVAAGQAVRIGLTVEDDGTNRLRSGEPLSKAIEELSNGPTESVLINCSQPEVVTRAFDELRKIGCAYGAYANGFKTVAPLRPGGTVKELEYRVDLGPDKYTEYVLNWIESGASIVGGCCEISPAHIDHINQTLIHLGVSVVNFDKTFNTAV